MANLKICIARLVRDLDIAPAPPRTLPHGSANEASRPSTGFTIMPASGTPLLVRSAV